MRIQHISGPMKMLVRTALPTFCVLLAGALTLPMLDASEHEARLLICEMSGTATLTRDYGNLLKDDLLEVSLSFTFDGKIDVSYSEPVTESGKMHVTHASEESLESSITHINTWDRKTSGSSFMTRIFGPYIHGNIGGISGPAPTRAGVGWRPGIEFFGETAGTELKGRYPVSAADWNLLPRRTLTMPDPLNKDSIMQVAQFDEMTAQCEYTGNASK